MRAVVQRVSGASVEVRGETVGRVDAGLLVYLGVAREDQEADARFLAEKVAGLRVFDDQRGVMNLPLEQVGGGVLVVSAFTTQGDARRGRRPSYAGAAPPEAAELLYDVFCGELARKGLEVVRGRFRSEMQVSSINDGPVCILLDSKKVF
ncbi:MAG: D-tyrosyl-tRNA(Tyr) deacylase [Phycisphaerales bacterium]|nr:MAG: D-tyrosyl-tRNA(Tyr) deacylase [Phycisphaerales bacterium]